MPKLPLLALLAALALPSAVLAQAPQQLGALPDYPATDRPAEIRLYESDAQIRALAERGPTVLFFFASWCPNCQAAIRDFQADWGSVKPGLTLLIVNYDTEAELKARYGVTYQDTYVQVAPDLSRVGIWNGGSIGGLNANTAGL